MAFFNRMGTQDGSRDGRRLLSVGGRVKVVAAVALVLLAVGVAAAYAALGAHDTATGTGALASEAGDNNNSAFGYFALHSNTTGSSNTAAGLQALYSNTTGNSNTASGLYALYSNTTGTANTALGVKTGGGATPNTTGSNNTFLGYKAAPAAAALTNATAIGANAVVSQSNSMVLGASGVNVGIGRTAPNSRLQIGAPTTIYGDYLQLPMVTNASPPPVGDCNTSTLVGRLVLQYNSSKTTPVILWVCPPTGVWKQLAPSS